MRSFVYKEYLQTSPPSMLSPNTLISSTPVQPPLQKKEQRPNSAPSLQKRRQIAIPKEVMQKPHALFTPKDSPTTLLNRTAPNILLHATTPRRVLLADLCDEEKDKIASIITNLQKLYLENKQWETKYETEKERWEQEIAEWKEKSTNLKTVLETVEKRNETLDSECKSLIHFFHATNFVIFIPKTTKTNAIKPHSW